MAPSPRGLRIGYEGAIYDREGYHYAPRHYYAHSIRDGKLPEDEMTGYRKIRATELSWEHQERLRRALGRASAAF